LGLRHGNPDDPGRHVGLGEPLVGTSWLNRPFHAGWLVGVVFGDELMGGHVDQDSGLFGGYRIGWDFDHYWGVEGRFAFTNVDLTFLEPSLVPAGSANHQYFDLNLLYFPWGDARWRPYVSLGIGVNHLRYEDDLRVHRNEVPFAFPISFGVKYLWTEWLALRGDLTDNWSFASGAADSMHSVSLTFAAEAHFGGSRKSYFPYDAGR
jgi:hypothetical protein